MLTWGGTFVRKVPAKIRADLSGSCWIVFI
jgi:hypothetical protein